MFADHRRELFPERLGPFLEALVVVLSEFDDVLVGCQDPLAADDVLLVVGLSLQRGCDFGGLNVTFEDTSERAFNQATETPLEGLQDSHSDFLPSRSVMPIRPGQRGIENGNAGLSTAIVSRRDGNSCVLA
jgi:hypothetical protein